MTWPAPQPGLVIRYSYLWTREARAGREEGVKDRPCAIILATVADQGRLRVVVLPITPTAPQSADEGIELLHETKVRLGLDNERSWVIVSEGNDFIWPGPDLRPLVGRGPESVAYGYLPPRLFSVIRSRFLAYAGTTKSDIVKRTE